VQLFASSYGSSLSTAYFKVGKIFFFIEASPDSHLSETNTMTESNGN